MAEAERQLILLRHAKSSWDDPTLPDHDRPLAPRGRRAAKLIGEHLRREAAPISLVLCSSAVRARETVEGVSPPGELEIDSALYAASVNELLGRLQSLSDWAKVVMLVGHNPAIAELATVLARDPSELSGRKFPTGALATFAFTGPWRSLVPGAAELIGFVTPRELG